MVPNPPAISQGEKDRAVQTPGVAEVNVLHTGLLLKLGSFKQTGKPFVLPVIRLPVHEHAQAGTVALLRMRFRSHNGFYQFLGVGTNLPGPAGNPGRRPLQIFLVRLGPVFGVGGSASRDVAAHMACYPSALVKYLDHLGSQAHVNLFTN